MIVALRGWNSFGKRLANGRMRLATFKGNATSFHALRNFVFAACIPSVVRVPSVASGRAGKKEKARADIALFSSSLPKLYFFYDPVVTDALPKALLDVAQRFASHDARRVVTFAVAVDRNDADARSPSKHLLYHVARLRALRADRKPIVMVSNLYHQGAIVFDWEGSLALERCASAEGAEGDAAAACAASTAEEIRDAPSLADALATFVEEFIALRDESGAEGEPAAEQFSARARRRREEKLAAAHDDAHGHGDEAHSDEL
jgi:hypothetical protein